MVNDDGRAQILASLFATRWSTVGDKIDRDAKGLGHNLGHNSVSGSIGVRVSARFQRHGEMSEWLKEHAWNAKRASNIEPLGSALTHTRSAA